MNETQTQTHTAEAGDVTTLREVLNSIDVHQEAGDYELRADGDYSPNDFERQLLEDFGLGLIGKIEETFAALAASPAPRAPAAVPEETQAAADVLAERRRQVEAEGWTPEHDDAHSRGEIARAACSYAYEAGRTGQQRSDSMGSAPAMWPWDLDWWKPSDARRDLVKAGALILAEIERLDRADPSPRTLAAAPAAPPADGGTEGLREALEQVQADIAAIRFQPDEKDAFGVAPTMYRDGAPFKNGWQQACDAISGEVGAILRAALSSRLPAGAAGDLVGERAPYRYTECQSPEYRYQQDTPGGFTANMQATRPASPAPASDRGAECDNPESPLYTPALAASPAPAASAGGEGATSTSETAGEGATSPVQDGAAPACGSSEGSPWSERAPSETTRLQEAIAETMEHAGKDPAQAFLRRTLARRREEEATALAPTTQVNPGRNPIARIIDPEAWSLYDAIFKDRIDAGETRDFAAADAMRIANRDVAASLAKVDAILAARPVAEGDAGEPFSFTGPELRKVEAALLTLGRDAIRSQKITQHDEANVALRKCWKAIEAVVAARGAPQSLRDALGSPFVTTVSGGGQKPYLRLTYPTMDEVHVAHDALAGLLNSPPPAARPAPSPAKGGTV